MDKTSSMDAGRIRFFHGISRNALYGRLVFFLTIAAVLTATVLSTASAVKWINRPFSGFLLNSRMYLGNTGQYHWTGAVAGLKFPDRILSANGRPIRSMKDLNEVVGNAKIGEAITYTVLRNGREVQVVVPTMAFSLLDYLFIVQSFLVIGFVYLLLAVVVFLLKPGTSVSWAYFWVGTVLSVYSITNFENMATHGILGKTYLLSNAFLFAPAVHLSMLFPEEKRFVRKWPWLKYVPYFLAVVLAGWFASTYPSLKFSRLFQLSNILALLGALTFLVSAMHSYFRSSSVIARQRAKVVLLGAALAFPLPAMFVVAGGVFGNRLGSLVLLHNYMMFPVLIFPMSIAYAISRHNLFDVDVFIKRTVGYAIMTAVVGAGYFGLQVGLESLVLTPVFGEAAHKITPALFAFLVVFLFNPLNRRIQNAVDRMFFRKKFDYKATVTAVSDALSSVLNLDEIVRKIVQTVRSDMFIDRSGLVLAGAQGGSLPAYFVGDDLSGVSEEILSDALPASDPLVELVRKKKKLITKYDVAEDPHFADVRETCGRRFEELGASLAVPLVYQGEVKAVLAVGHKKSGHFFTSEDIELLQTLASHGAVAIESANLAEQMKKEEAVRTNLSRYLSPQIVDRIVQNNVQVNLGGDRKVVTVLFSDIRNFTTITESRPPDQLIQILNEYFTSMAETIFEQQGSLDKYIGDAIVAVFGSLIPLENPARKAVAAAVAMMNRLPDLNRRWEERFGFSMNIGIGVNTGEVFLGNIGSPERMEFTVIGDAVNVASRFSGLAKPGQILVTKETLAHLGADFMVREHPPAEVKGKSGKLEVFEIVYTQPEI